MTPAERVLDELDSSQRGLSARRLRLWLISAAILVFYALSWNLAGIDLQKLGTGLPKLTHWIAQAWPPKLAEVPLFALPSTATNSCRVAAKSMSSIAGRHGRARSAAWHCPFGGSGSSLQLAPGASRSCLRRPDRRSIQWSCRV